MKQWLKNSRKSMAACGAVAVMLVAGWQFGISGTEAPFSEKEVALEKAIAGSDCMTFTFKIVDWDPLACQGPAGLCALIVC